MINNCPSLTATEPCWFGASSAPQIRSRSENLEPGELGNRVTQNQLGLRLLDEAAQLGQLPHGAGKREIENDVLGA